MGNVGETLLGRHAQLLQLGGDFFRMFSHIHVRLDVTDDAVLADVYRMAC